MAELKRKVVLSLSSGSNSIVLTDLRIDFDVQSHLANAIDKCTVTVYNLAPETIKYLATNNIKMKLQAGYVGGILKTVFEGEVINFNPVKMYQDHMTYLYCYTDQSTSMGNPVEFTGKKNIKLKTLINLLAEQAGFPMNSGRRYNDELFPREVLETTVVSTFTGSRTVREELNLLGKQYNFFVSTSGGVLRIIREQRTGKDLSRYIDSTKNIVVNELKMKGAADFGLAEVSLRYDLSPEIFTGYGLEVPKEISATIKGFNEALFLIDGIGQLAPERLYQIFTVNHKGSNYTDEWDSEITAYIHKNLRGRVNG